MVSPLPQATLRLSLRLGGSQWHGQLGWKGRGAAAWAAAQRSQHAGERKVGSDQSWEKIKIKIKTTNEHRGREGKKRKEKERKIRYGFSNNLPVLKGINACSAQGPHPRAQWDGKGCVTESSFLLLEMRSVGALGEALPRLSTRSSQAQGSTD